MTTSMGRQQLLEVETTCGMLLNELQLIWDEVGENDQERDQMLLELEQECLAVYRRKVDQANRSRASFHQLLADIHSEIVALASALGDHPPMAQLENRGISLKEQLAQLKPILEEMTRKKEERLRLFQEIRAQIQRIQCEISPLSQPMEVPVHEQDLTQRKLEELQSQLQILQKEKNDRLYKVVEYVDIIHDLCAMLDCDFFMTIREVHPTLDESSSSQAKSISNETINRLGSTIQSLREKKRRRMQQIQDLGSSLLELWNLMDTPVEEQHQFQHVTCNIAAAEHEIVTAGTLSLRVIEQAEAEVERLEHLKASKMKELVLKKQTELEEICRRAHIIPDGHTAQDKTIASMESGMVDPAELLASIEEQIGSIKEEAFSRRDIMDKIEKWMAACEEESWLEEYNKDENRYNATRGAHLNLKHAERARATVGKIPALVESLISRTTAWEEERGKPFLYDGVRLLSTVEEYNILRMEKEEERRRQRDQKRLHEQLVNEQETLFGSRPSPNGRTPLKKGVTNSRLNGGSTPASRRISVGGAMLQQESPAVVRQNGITPGRNESKSFGGAMLQQELPAVARLNGITPGRNESKSFGGAMLQESPAAARLIGITPGRHGPTPAANKDSRIKITHTPASVNRVLLPEEDNLPPPGVFNMKHPSNLPPMSVSGHETDAQSALPRLPLSPVSASGMRPNTNIEGHAATSTAVKAAITLMKSPLSATPLGRPAITVVDEENTTPRKQTAPQQQQTLQQQQSQSPSPLLQQSPLPFVPQFQRSQEYSFEERRLALMYHHQSQHVSTWTDCR